MTLAQLMALIDVEIRPAAERTEGSIADAFAFGSGRMAGA